MSIEEYRAEFQAALEQMVEEREGLDDMARLNIVAARAGVAAQIAIYERRRLLLVAAEQARARFERALQNLGNDGYPEIAPFVLSVEAIAELDEQERTWAKARAKFSAAAEADQAEITAKGPAEDMPVSVGVKG